MPYTGPHWSSFDIGDHTHVRRDPDEPRDDRSEWSGRITDVSKFGFMLARDDNGDRRFHSWDPGPRYHQTVTPIP